MKLWILLIATLAGMPNMATAQSYDNSPEFRFGGVNVGASIDYRWLDGDYALPRINGRIDDNRGGIGYRGFLGYDAQLGRLLVVGGEVGIGGGGKTLSVESQTGDYSLKPRWTWDISGRVGILPAPNVLLYGRVGYSWLRTREITDFRAANLQDLSASGTEKGFLWGGGVESKLAGGFFARGEYSRSDYGAGLISSKVQLGVGFGF